MKRNRVILQDKAQADAIDKARAKRSRKATKSGKEPDVPVTGGPAAEAGGVTETIKDMTQGAVAKVEEWVNTAAEKIKDVVEGTPAEAVSDPKSSRRAAAREKPAPPS